jgi:hypothetical protein
MGEHRCYSLRPFLLGRQTRVISFLGRTRTCSLLSPRQQRLLVAVLVRRDPKRKRAFDSLRGVNLQKKKRVPLHDGRQGDLNYPHRQSGFPRAKEHLSIL